MRLIAGLGALLIGFFAWILLSDPPRSPGAADSPEAKIATLLSQDTASSEAPLQAAFEKAVVIQKNADDALITRLPASLRRDWLASDENLPADSTERLLTLFQAIPADDYETRRQTLESVLDSQLVSPEAKAAFGLKQLELETGSDPVESELKLLQSSARLISAHWSPDLIHQLWTASLSTLHTSESARALLRSELGIAAPINAETDP